MNFLWQLGTSSYYVDEALSIDNALPSLRGVITLVNRTESNPWTYFLALHEWLGRTGSQAEWVTRLPSALAGVALVAAVYWLARAFLAPLPSLGAAALAALSPLVVQYAQEVRAYVFVMLALAIAAGATVRAARDPARKGMLVLGALAAIAALWLHYMAVLVVAPLCVWLALQPALSRRRRTGFIGACVLAELLMVPLFVEQYPNSGGLNGIAVFAFRNVATVIGTPFDGRFVRVPLAIRLIGAAAVIGAFAAVAVFARRVPREPRLLLALSSVPLLAILAAGIAGKDIVATRYTAVAAPFIIVAIAGAVSVLPRGWALALAVLALFPAIWGTVKSHGSGGFYPPSKQTMTYIRNHRQPGDVIVFAVRPGTQWPYELYGRRLLHPQPLYIDPGDTSRVLAAFRERRRIWLVAEVPAARYQPQTLLQEVSPELRPHRYRPLLLHVGTTIYSSLAILAVPQ